MTKPFRLNVNSFIRALSFVFIVISLSACALIAGGIPGPDAVCLIFLSAAAVASFPPCSDEIRIRAAGYAAGLAVLMLACMSAGLPCKWCVMLLGLSVQAQTLMLSCSGLRSGRRLFTARTAWRDLTNYGRLVWTSVLMTLLVIFLVLEGTAWPMIILCLLSVSYYVFVLIKAASGRTYLMPLDRETDIRCPYPARMPAASDPQSEQRRIYDLAVKTMETDQDFLDAGFNLKDFSRKLGTNRTYLSRVVNECSGKSFPQFVNHFRVEYAASVLRGSTDRILIRELAEMVGYNSPETLKSAFRLVYGKTPTEYHQEMMSKRLVRRPSSPKEQER